MNTIEPTAIKRGRGRPRLYASPEEAQAARATRIARREDEALQQRIADADATAATQTPVDVLLVTIAQAAAALQLSDRTIHTLIADGHLPSVKILGTRRIWLDDLKKFARTGTPAHHD